MAKNLLENQEMVFLAGTGLGVVVVRFCETDI